MFWKTKKKESKNEKGYEELPPSYEQSETVISKWKHNVEKAKFEQEKENSKNIQKLVDLVVSTMDEKTAKGWNFVLFTLFVHNGEMIPWSRNRYHARNISNDFFGNDEFILFLYEGGHRRLGEELEKRIGFPVQIHTGIGDLSTKNARDVKFVEFKIEV